MNWFKENKFLGGLIVVTAILAGLIIFLGVSTAGKRDEAVTKVEERKTSIKQKKSLDPYPTIENVSSKKNNLKEVVSKAEEMQAKFLSFRPESLDKIAANTFSDRLKKSDAEVRSLFEEKRAKLPEQAYLGFEDYKGALPREDSTGVLAYELAAIDWLFRELANAGVSEVVNFRRERLPIEDGASWDDSKKPAPRGKKNTKPAKGKAKKAPAAIVIPTIPVAKRLPIELTFEGSELAVRKAIQAIANSDQFFFDARIARVKNYSAVPSSKGIKSAAADPVAEVPKSSDGFGDVVEEEEPASVEELEAPSSTEILQRVAGGEDVSVFIRLDLLLFDETLKFPTIK
ncbi:MAG: Amuc_1100 family pilus-like protein [Verrucomicrobiaceae bacterium]